MKSLYGIKKKLEEIKAKIPDRESRNDNHTVHAYEAGWFDALKWVLEEK